MTNRSELIARAEQVISEVETQLDGLKKVLSAIDGPQTFSLEETAEILGVSRSYVYKLRKRWEEDTEAGVADPGGLPVVYFFDGATPRVRRLDIDRLQQRRHHG